MADKLVRYWRDDSERPAEMQQSPEGERRSLAVHSGAREFGLLTAAGELADRGYARVPGRMTEPRRNEDGLWAVWNDEAIEFPPLAAEDDVEVRAIGIYDDGVLLASVAVEPFSPIPRLQPRFPIGKIVVRVGVG